ncbi:MAG: hypothetical protein IIZ38_01375 [Sphingomonas sp.]|uniref:hypothetical protein n=1 Tax=Sphingomonas sp. TaxID=28214 RepID=UPI0025CFB6FE|nr:hypothetical protein [Sphingomonas sp.]MBQ1496943.1 hypothetical protein [Sphingomonas sp.]
MSFLAKILLIFSACFLTTAGASTQSLPKYYKVSLQIERGGKIIGKPNLIMTPGASAIMTATNGEYSLRTSTGTDGGIKTSSINVATELYFSSNGRWELVAVPNIFATIGRSVDMHYNLPKYGNVVLTYNVEVVDTLATNVTSWGKNACSEKRVSEWKAAMKKPVSFLSARKKNQVINICCSPCSTIRCCSAGPICCSDEARCPGQRCCSDPPV